MADLSLPPEEHGGDDGKVTSAGVGGWWGACIKLPAPASPPLTHG